MVTWNNLDTLASYQELKDTAKVNLAEVMTGENGAERVKNYSIPMAAGFTYNYAAKAVDDNVLAALVKLADEAQLADKFKELYNGAVINTGENNKKDEMHQFYVSDAAEKFGEFANSILPYDVKRARKINIEEY